MILYILFAIKAAGPECRERVCILNWMIEFLMSLSRCYIRFAAFDITWLRTQLTIIVNNKKKSNNKVTKWIISEWALRIASVNDNENLLIVLKPPKFAEDDYFNLIWIHALRVCDIFPWNNIQSLSALGSPGYSMTTPPSPSSTCNGNGDVFFNFNDLRNPQTDDFYGSPRAQRRFRSHSFSTPSTR